MTCVFTGNVKLGWQSIKQRAVHHTPVCWWQLQKFKILNHKSSRYHVLSQFLHTNLSQNQAWYGFAYFYVFQPVAIYIHDRGQLQQKPREHGRVRNNFWVWSTRNHIVWLHAVLLWNVKKWWSRLFEYFIPHSSVCFKKQRISVCLL